MSRFNNPQAAAAARAQSGPHAQPDQDPNQGWGVPNTAGRPAAHAQQSASLSGYTRPDPYAQQPAGYGSPPGGYGQADSAASDPFSALRTDAPQPMRTDAYAYPQQPVAPTDPYANGQYAPQPYAQGFNPYAGAPAAQPQGFGGAGNYFPPTQDAGYARPGDPRTTGFNPASFDPWSATQPHQDASGLGSPLAHGYDAGYQTSPRTQPQAGMGQWGGHDGYAQPGHEPPFDGNGFAQNGQAHAGSGFDQTYADDEAHYEGAKPGRSWKKIGVLLASTIVLGGGLAYAYSSLMGSPSGDAPPVVKGAEGPFKVKPSDPGGKQFAHADSKIMGRLGEGGSDPTPASDNVEAGGARKVPVLVVARDGSIQPPAPLESESTRATVAVPGLTVIDGLGGAPRTNAAAAAPASAPTPTAAASEPAQKPLVVSPPAAPVKPKVLASAEPTSLNDSSGDAPVATAPVQKKAAAVKKPAPVTTAALTETAPTGPQPTGAGYVAVLASVPASGKSRIEALKRFADMQQKYGSTLQNKTPEVQEANLGEKGTYHRLLVGPPGSRDSASEVCSQLKGQGYSDCWVTAY